MLMAERVFPSIAGSAAWGITGMIQAKRQKMLGIGEKDETNARRLPRLFIPIVV